MSFIDDLLRQAAEQKRWEDQAERERDAAAAAELHASYEPARKQRIQEFIRLLGIEKDVSVNQDGTSFSFHHRDKKVEVSAILDSHSGDDGYGTPTYAVAIRITCFGAQETWWDWKQLANSGTFASVVSRLVAMRA